jgi:hypothetical protein
MTWAQFVEVQKEQIPRWLKPSRNDKSIDVLGGTSELGPFPLISLRVEKN